MSASHAARHRAAPSIRPADLQISVTADGRCLSLRGDLDLATGPDLADAIERVDPIPGKVVVVDLTDLTFCDCAGIGALVGQHHRLNAAGSALMIVDPPKSFRRLLELTGLDEELEVRLAS